MKKIKGAPAIIGLILMGMLLAQGCGGGGQSLESIVSPSQDTEDHRFVNQKPSDLPNYTDEEIGPEDTAPITTFYGGADIATSGATYLDPSICEGCHSDKYAAYKETKHAKTWDAHAGSFGFDGTDTYCVKCHTLTGPFLDLNDDHVYQPEDGEVAPFGLSPSTTAGEFGIAPDTFSNSDEVPEEFQNVQCENCHGPASLHNGNKDFIVAGEQAFAPSTCAYCHPQYEEWTKALHSVGAVRTSASCAPCHTGDGFVAFLDNEDTDDIVDFAVNYNELDEDAGAVHQIGCATCHDPHDIDGGEHQLRQPADELCETCHSGRKKLPGDSHAPHHNLQGRVRNGQGLMNPDNKMLWDSEKLLCNNMEYSASSDPTTTCGDGVNYRYTVKTTIEPTMGNASCVDCHMYTHVDHSGESDYGHTFKPRTEACQECHTTMSDPSDIIGRRQHDFELQIEALNARLEAAEANSDNFTDEQQTLYDNAAWNILYMEDDGSEGMHNGDLIDAGIQYTDEMLTKLGY